MTAHLLSVQSHVARDYVGNRGCGLALQLLGHEVDIINTVSFSSMYVHQGHVLSESDFATMMNGLCKAMACPTGSGVVGGETEESVDLKSHDIPVVLSGYIGNPAVLRILGQHVQKFAALPCSSPLSAQLRRFLPFMKERSTLFVMDPVIGDNGRPYVSPAMQAEYKAALQYADIILPNEHELNWSLGERHFGQPLGDLPTLCNVMGRVNSCHQAGPSIVFVTSCQIQEIGPDRLLAVLSARHPTSCHVVLCLFPKLDAYLGGAGDVVSALVVHRLLRLAKLATGPATSADYSSIMQSTIGTLRALMLKSMEGGDISINVVKHRDVLAAPSATAQLQVTAVEAGSPISCAKLGDALHMLLR
eukprot:Protomagalhaensia_wolfi_Nauph_80__5796@NODE_719_length_2070_cov_53_779911_g536_i0_p1_GENE_NODE_719_length_2070_cov_53_779911_g536_i0NODE_719_length_2070_cov_53_779911_g536_i0_p1_ORF_typecomplete_len361_score44_03Phos_pyr_kin/PF08543_12/4_8e20Phos_pyr_kin/PF08543_12/3_3e03PfkB/PF00294_24/5_1e05_NODE_719_length_2070_cov_53_779911_g536_i09141996